MSGLEIDSPCSWNFSLKCLVHMNDLGHQKNYLHTLSNHSTPACTQCLFALRPANPFRQIRQCFNVTIIPLILSTCLYSSSGGINIPAETGPRIPQFAFHLFYVKCKTRWFDEQIDLHIRNIFLQYEKKSIVLISRN